jgi:hypothetical protein
MEIGVVAATCTWKSGPFWRPGSHVGHPLAEAAAVGGIMALPWLRAAAGGGAPGTPDESAVQHDRTGQRHSGAASGATLVLAAGCTYQVSAPLPRREPCIP